MNLGIKKIVVLIPHRGIGDVIFHMPLLRSLYKNYGVKITIISNKTNKSKNILKEENFLKKMKSQTVMPCMISVARILF